MELLSLNLPLDVYDPETSMLVEAAVSWVKANTTFDFETAEEVPANIRLFIVKYYELMCRSGITQESIAGMSQSFDTSQSITALLRQLASELLSEYGYSSCKFTPAKRRWVM